MPCLQNNRFNAVKYYSSFPFTVHRDVVRSFLRWAGLDSRKEVHTVLILLRAPWVRKSSRRWPRPEDVFNHFDKTRPQGRSARIYAPMYESPFTVGRMDSPQLFAPKIGRELSGEAWRIVCSAYNSCGEGAGKRQGRQIDDCIVGCIWQLLKSNLRR
jgi:hypothetical protein